MAAGEWIPIVEQKPVDFTDDLSNDLAPDMTCTFKPISLIASHAR